jgi:hypothetical protein
MVHQYKYVSGHRKTFLFIFQGTSSIDGAQLSRFYLKTETESSL